MSGTVGGEYGISGAHVGQSPFAVSLKILHAPSRLDFRREHIQIREVVWRVAGWVGDPRQQELHALQLFRKFDNVRLRVLECVADGGG